MANRRKETELERLWRLLDAGRSKEAIELALQLLAEAQTPLFWTGAIRRAAAEALVDLDDARSASEQYEELELTNSLLLPRLRPAWWLTLGLRYPQFLDASAARIIALDCVTSDEAADDAIAYAHRALAFISHQSNDGASGLRHSLAAADAFARARQAVPPGCKQDHLERFEAATCVNVAVEMGKQGQLELARGWLQRASDCFSRHSSALIAFQEDWGRAWLSLLTGDGGQALRSARQCLARMPASNPAWVAEIRLLEARSSYLLGRTDEAVELAMEARQAAMAAPNGFVLDEVNQLLAALGSESRRAPS